MLNFDMQIIDLVNKIQFPLLDKIMIFFTSLGNAGIIWIVIGIVLVLRKETRQLGVLLLTALFITAALGEGILKNLIKRERPFEIVNSLKLLIPAPISYSFPSGHTASSFTAFGVFYFMNFRYKWCVLILASLIAFSRIYLNVHWTTDIIGGILLGLTVSYITCKVFVERRVVESVDEDVF